MLKAVSKQVVASEELRRNLYSGILLGTAGEKKKRWLLVDCLFRFNSLFEIKSISTLHLDGSKDTILSDNLDFISATNDRCGSSP